MVFFLRRLALIALVWACAFVALTFFVAVVTRLIIATVVVLTAWWISRQGRAID
jgi:hypothetical protein